MRKAIFKHYPYSITFIFLIIIFIDLNWGEWGKNWGYEPWKIMDIIAIIIGVPTITFFLGFTVLICSYVLKWVFHKILFLDEPDKWIPRFLDGEATSKPWRKRIAEDWFENNVIKAIFATFWITVTLLIIFLY